MWLTSCTPSRSDYGQTLSDPQTETRSRTRPPTPSAAARILDLPERNLGLRDRRRRSLARSPGGAVERYDPRPLRARDRGERRRRHGLLPPVLVPPHLRGPCSGEKRAPAPPLRRRGLGGDRVGERRARRLSRGGLYAVLAGSDRSPRGGPPDGRRAGGRRSGRSGEAARQAGLEAGAPFDLVSAHDRHLADGLAGEGPFDLDRQRPLGPQPGALGDRLRSLDRG